MRKDQPDENDSEALVALKARLFAAKQVADIPLARRLKATADAVTKAEAECTRLRSLMAWRLEEDDFDEYERLQKELCEQVRLKVSYGFEVETLVKTLSSCRKGALVKFATGDFLP